MINWSFIHETSPISLEDLSARRGDVNAARAPTPHLFSPPGRRFPRTRTHVRSSPRRQRAQLSRQYRQIPTGQFFRLLKIGHDARVAGWSYDCARCIPLRRALFLALRAGNPPVREQVRVASLDTHGGRNRTRVRGFNLWFIMPSR